LAGRESHKRVPAFLVSPGHCASGILRSFVELLRCIAGKLDQSDIQYMITGSIAASYYGLTRATQDLDIVISATPEELGLASQWNEAQRQAGIE
jgi:hypothetical protein